MSKLARKLSPEASALLKAARKAHDPSDAERTHLYQALQGALGASAVDVLRDQVHTQNGGTGANPTTAGSAPAAQGTSITAIGAKTVFGAKTFLVGTFVAMGLLARLSFPTATTIPTSARTSEVNEHASMLVEAPPSAEGTPAEPSDDAMKHAASEVEAARAEHTTRVREPSSQPSQAVGTPRVAIAYTDLAGIPTAKVSDTKDEEVFPQSSAGDAPPKSKPRSRSPASPDPMLRTAPVSVGMPRQSNAGMPRQSNAGDVSLIGTALKELNEGRAEEALRILALHAQRFPNSPLRVERAGLRVLALCALGQLDASTRERDEFLRDHAKIPLARRVAFACKNGQR